MIPLGLTLTSFLGSSVEMSPTLPWLLLAGLGTMHAMLYRTSGVPIKKRFIFEIAMFLVLITILVLYTHDIFRQLEPCTPYIAEAIPLIFIFFCALWIKTFGMPNRADLQRYGALLGLLCVIDLVAEAALYQAAPTVRWIGNVDVLAGLLLVALCASLRPGTNDGGVYEPDQGHRIWRILIMVGIAACLSRTGLFAAAWIYLCFGRGRKLVRVACSLLFLALIGLTFLLPITPSDAVRYIDYWLWVESIRLYTKSPMLLLTGFPIGSALPISFPMGMSGIWEAATGSPAMMGVYLPQVPSFWLRLTLAWGIGVPLALLATIFSLLFRHLTRMGAGLIAALFAQGMTSPLLFDPAMAAAIGFAFFLVLSKSERVSNSKVEKTEKYEIPPKPETPTKAGPVEEWNIRPL